MRLVSGALEHAGIATVVAGTMRGMIADLPRVLITGHSRGANFGPAGDAAAHASLARQALALFDVTEQTLRDQKS